MNTETATTPLKAKKTYKVMPTVRQRRVARLMVDTALGKHPEIKGNGDIVVQAGYSPANATQPSRILNTTGVKDALYDIGFTEENAKNVVKSILENDDAKHSDRLKAADMVFKVHGTYAAEKHMTLNIDANVDNTALMALAERLRDSTR